MNKQELDSLVRECVTDNSGIEIYFGLKKDIQNNNDENYAGILRKANFSREAQNEILKLYKNEINKKIFEKQYSVLDLSTCDERQNVIYKYDYDLTDEMQVFNEIEDPDINIPLFSFRDDGVSSISFFLIQIGTVDKQLTIFKKIANVNIYKKDSSMFAFFSGNCIEQVDKDFIRIVPSIELLKVNEQIFVFKLDLLSSAFKMYDVITKAAKKQIEEIRNYNLVEDVDSLEEEINDISFARKLSKVATNSPVLGHVDVADIISFAKGHDKLKDIMKYSDDETKFLLKTKESRKEFLKILNDDYLISKLTNNSYNSLAKDQI